MEDQDLALERERAIAIALAHADDEPEAGSGIDVADLLKSAGSGLVKGAAYVGDLANPVKGVQNVISGVSSMVNGTPAPVDPFHGQVQEAAEASIPSVVGYKPTTSAGGYAQSIAQNVPGMALGGPASLTRNAITAVGSGVGAQYLGEKYENTPWEGWARFTGSMVGGFAGAGKPIQLGLPRKVAAKAAKQAPPPEYIAEQKNKFYEDLRASGITYDVDGFQQHLQGMTSDLIKKDFGPVVAAPVHQMLGQIAREAGSSPPGLGQIESYIQNVGEKARQASRAGSTQEAAAWYKVRDGLEEFQENGNFASAAGNVSHKDAMAMKSAARSFALIDRKQRRLSDALAVAEQAPQGFINALRTELNNIIKADTKPKPGKKLFDESEKKILTSISKGNFGLNMLSHFGLDPSKHGYGFTSLAGPAAATFMANTVLPGAALPLGVAGIPANIGRNMLGKRNMNNMIKGIGSDAPGVGGLGIQGSMEKAQKDLEAARMRQMMNVEMGTNQSGTVNEQRQQRSQRDAFRRGQS